MRWTSLGLALVCLLAGCEDRAPAPIRLGTSVWPGYEPLYLARELGLLEGSSVRLVELTSASEVMRLLRNGALEAAALTLDEALLLGREDLDLQVVLVLDTSHGGDAIVARPPATTVAELRGRRVAVEDTAVAGYVLSRALEKHGVEPTAITAVPLQVSEHAAAYAAGRVDAVVTYEPVLSALLAAGARRVFDSSQIPDEVLDVLVVRGDVLRARRAELERASAAWFQALERLHGDRLDAARRIAPRMGCTPEAFLSSLDGLRIPDRAQNLALLGDGAPRLTLTARDLARRNHERGLGAPGAEARLRFSTVLLGAPGGGG